MQGTISVVVPVYNVERHLDKCIVSLCRQTYSELDLILIDDGSTDSSPSICDKYAVQDTRVTVIHQKNRGVSSARNAGIELATGDYIAFIDSDDFVDPEYFDVMLKMISEANADICACGPMRETIDGTVIWKSPPMHRTLQTEEAICALFRRDMYCGWPWNKLFKSNLIKNHGIRFDESLRICEDLLFNFQVFSHAKSVVYDSRAPMYHYIVNNTSANLKMQTDGFFDYNYLNRLDADAKLEALASQSSRKIRWYCSANSFITNENILSRALSLKCRDPDLCRRIKSNLRKNYLYVLLSHGFGGMRQKTLRALLCLFPETIYKITH